MLLDTHVLIWLLEGNERLGPSTRQQIEQVPLVHVSAASLWEMAIKVGLGRLTAPDDLLAQVEAAGLQQLSVSPSHAWAVRHESALPRRDPFDHLLVTQAVIEGFPFVTADRAILGAVVDGLVAVDARQ